MNTKDTRATSRRMACQDGADRSGASLTRETRAGARSRNGPGLPPGSGRLSKPGQPNAAYTLLLVQQRGEMASYGVTSNDIVTFKGDREVLINATRLILERREHITLKALALAALAEPGTFLSAAVLAQRVAALRGEETRQNEEQELRLAISGLRKQLKLLQLNPNLILNLRNSGYRLNATPKNIEGLEGESGQQSR